MDAMGEGGEEPYRASSLSLAYFELEVLMEAYTLAGKEEMEVQLELFYKRGSSETDNLDWIRDEAEAS